MVSVHPDSSSARVPQLDMRCLQRLPCLGIFGSIAFDIFQFQNECRCGVFPKPLIVFVIRELSVGFIDIVQTAEDDYNST